MLHTYTFSNMHTPGNLIQFPLHVLWALCAGGAKMHQCTYLSDIYYVPTLVHGEMHLKDSISFWRVLYFSTFFKKTFFILFRQEKENFCTENLNFLAAIFLDKILSPTFSSNCIFFVKTSIFFKNIPSLGIHKKVLSGYFFIEN